MTRKLKILLFFLLPVTQNCYGWGFYAHSLINRHAVYALPDGPLFSFFKLHIEQLASQAVNPDKRRHLVPDEAPKHYIDFEAYQKDSALIPKYWKQAVKAYSEDSLSKHGVLPWNLAKVQQRLTAAMQQKNGKEIVRLAADLGHYVGDAHVPLHTTCNYDGQLTDQKGIHALWESRLPELYARKYDYLTGKASFVQDVQKDIWKAVYHSHAAVDSVLHFEKQLSAHLTSDHKYAFEERNGQVLKVYSTTFSQHYSESLNGQVERQLISSIKMVADLWYTSWIEAGQPDLTTLTAPADKEETAPSKEKINNDRFLESYHQCAGDHVFITTTNK